MKLSWYEVKEQYFYTLSFSFWVFFNCYKFGGENIPCNQQFPCGTSPDITSIVYFKSLLQNV